MSNPGNPPSADLTRLLHAYHQGDRSAFDQLVPLVYHELGRMAHRHLQRGGPRTLLETAVLVNEAFLKLAGSGSARWEDREHFLAVASCAMRQIIVDTARRRAARKRGGAWQRTSLGDGPADGLDVSEELLALDAALDRLNEVSPRQRAVVEHKFFGGRTDDEISALLGVSVRSVQRDWRLARARLYDVLYGSAG